MGGIIDASIAVNCDRCGKSPTVPGGEQTDFYKAFDGREDKDEKMLTVVMATPGIRPPEEEVQDGWRCVEFEYMCPKCIETVNKYMDKIARTKSDDVPGKPEEKPKTEAAAATGDDDEKNDDEPRNSEPEATEDNGDDDGGDKPPAANAGSDFDESELFGE